jgi:hypothetical protein
MNVPYPGFSQHAGFVTSAVLVVVLSGGLYLLFQTPRLALNRAAEALCRHIE